MATVISLTEAKIRELLSDYEGVALSQDEINALVGQLLVSQQTVVAQMEELENTTIPQLVLDVASGSIQVSDLNDTVIPELEAALDQNTLALANLNTVLVPDLQARLQTAEINVAESPKTYHTEEMPTNPDVEDERPLVVGDTWYDPNDNNKQYVWNGVEWTTTVGAGDVSDFSLTAQKFNTNTHMIY